MDDMHFIYDRPYEYKNIKLYPIKVEKYLEFNSCVNCLLLEKNKIPDIRIIKMNYLEWLVLLSKQDENNKIFLDMLFYLFYLVFGEEQKSVFYEDIDGKIYFEINNFRFDSQDFDEIKNIILKQNGLNYEEIIMDETLEKALKEAQEYYDKHSNSKMADFEEQIVFYHIYNGYDYEKIYNLPIRKFNKGLERIQILENYRICKTGEMSGMVSFKEEIQYFLAHIEPKGRFDNLIIKDANKKIGEMREAIK